MTPTRAAARDGPRVLLLWPGGLLRSGANFGVPALLGMAGLLRKRLDATVDVVDLDMERAFGPVDLGAIARRGYDLCGIACYSSYDYLKVMAVAAALRAELPEAVFVAGGYHPSAVPADFTGEGSPFDYVVVGDGEAPLCALLEQLGQGRRPSERVLGPEPWTDLDGLPPYDWSLLERYRPVARQRASQAEIYLSRGCPHQCAFCMERAKGESAWRAFSPERAVAELRRLDRFLDLSQWTLFVADAVFGLRPSWRREVLAELGRAPLRARKIWLLTRVDGLERIDLELMARANVALGFGLESGDPAMLAQIHKAGDAASYLERMTEVARWAVELDLPFGANVIVGHPGETEQSLTTSAAYLRRLFLEQGGAKTGFLSVDPFRLYPGSTIAVERAAWERATGMRAHRYPWWHDGDQDFLAEWLSPSADLGFRRTLTLRRQLFDPLLLEIPRQFSYLGPGADYFQRALDEQVRLTRPQQYLHTLGMWHLWRELGRSDDASDAPPDDGPVSVADDDELAELSRAARDDTLARRRWPAPGPVLAALRDVPRER
ncbi:MAG: B12-binding domain-containing radical SAM protein, partial [Deltaproteobacteria bacterium]|nr:B12-binding domain-containing radical SAM protein [Deltaproteobacteria bacterium]MBW2533394.1 B12-binding domain-containing radical SAM protein [Deltaproteobacteria bacterium]